MRVVVIDPEGRERLAYLREGDEGPIRVGRAPENDLQIVSPYISRRHAEIWPHERGVLYEDLASTSGSYLDGVRIDKTLVRAGEMVRLGSPDGLRLTVYAAGEEGRPAAPQRASSRTEVLRVADLEESPYLSTTGQLFPGRRRSPAERKNQQRLIALISLTTDLLDVRDADDMSEKLLARVMELLPVDRGMVLLEREGELEPRVWNIRGKVEIVRSEVQIGPRTDGEETLSPGRLERPELPFEPISTVTDRVFDEGVGLLSLDAVSDERLEGSKSVLLQSVRSIMAAPIASAKQVYGVVYLDTHRTLRKDDEDTLDWLVAVAHQAGLVMEKLKLLEQQRTMTESLMKGLAASIDARDGMTAGHSARVAHYSVGIARTLELDVEQQYAIYYAALLHDYGKIGIDDAVLKKPARLTGAEFEHIRLHPKFTFDILSKIAFPPWLSDLPMMAASHHERWDGKGYPWGLRDTDIPLAGRIIAIADVFDSLTRERHYRSPMPVDEVLRILEQGRGEQFDPVALDAFLDYYRQELEEKERRREELRKRRKERTSGSQPPVSSPEVEVPTDEDIASVDVDEDDGTLRVEPGHRG